MTAFITSPALVGSVVFLVGLAGLAWLIEAVFHRLSALSLPILALSSVLLLLGALLVFTTLIHLLNLSDPKSALGLPEGSVRALLALALLGLFAIMASDVLVTPSSYQLNHIPGEAVSAMISAAPDLTWAPENSDPKKPTFKATLQTPAKFPDEFGKQMLTLVGTLMTAVISFYFGSAASSPRAQGESAAQPNPASVTPTTARKTVVQPYTITGTRLADVKRVEALPENGGTPVVADVRATDTEAKFTLTLPEKGKWTLHVVTAWGARASVPGAIDVTDS